jgi:hypothetical protein
MIIFRRCSNCGYDCRNNRETKQFPENCPSCGNSLRNQSWYIDYHVNGTRRREAIGPNKRLAEEVMAKRSWG